MPWVIFLTSSDTCWSTTCLSGIRTGSKSWLCLSGANLVHSMNKHQQVWWLQGTGPGLQTGREEGLPLGWMTLAVSDMLPVKTHSCLAPMLYWKGPTIPEQAGCHSDRWASEWPRCQAFWASSVPDNLSLCQDFPSGCLPPDLDMMCVARCSPTPPLPGAHFHVLIGLGGRLGDS